MQRIGGRSAPWWTAALLATCVTIGPAPANGQAKSGPTGSNAWISSGTGPGSSWISGSAGSSQGGGGGIVVGGGFGGVGAVGSGPNHIDYNPPIIVGYGPYGPIFYASPIIVVGPGGSAPVASPLIPPEPPAAFGGGGGGMMLPVPPKEAAPARPPARRSNPARAREHVEIGDRSFRGDNTKRAEDRYRLAQKADPGSATPLVRLAQVALVRGRYADAARFLREAVAAEPGFLLNAPDIQTLFAEPGDFARELAALETHLQTQPGDRDAWFVLGAEWYLSGRTQKAADAFRRLTDRKPDLALAAFLDATSPRLTEAAPQ
ncbi:tetratricopeptide repeat protein [Tundrisphaera sp. TA3]|uniref:tetratricopeptide repeat protein n=1 Tax=Tundrisphaera sp. TA3 TaxID=3435775 RepID=UPI003EBF5138